MKIKFNTKQKISVLVVALMLTFSVGVFATGENTVFDSDEQIETDGITSALPTETGNADSETADAETTVQSEPKTTVATEYGIEVTITSTKAEYAANELPQLSLNVRNTNSYNIRNLIAKANLPSALSYVGSTRAVISVPDMQAGHSQNIDFQIKRASSSGGGGGSVNTADSNSNLPVYIILGVAILIFVGVVVFAVLSGKDKNKTKILTLFLCVGMALQCLPLTAEAQTDSGSFNVIHTIKYNSVDYGINITVSFGDAPVANVPGNTNASDAHGWEELQILDFSVDVSDVLVNETVNAKFSAVVLASERANDQTLKLYEGNTAIGVFKDDGTNGDTTANDGVFTTSVQLSSATAKNTEYFASNGTLRSEPVEICFYEEIKDDSFEKFQRILDEINTKDDYNDVISYLESSEYVTAHFYDEETGSVTFTTTFGILGVWSTEENGMKEDGVFTDSDIEYLTNMTQELANSGAYNLENKKIAVLRPYRNGGFAYDDFLTLANSTSNAIRGTVTDIKDKNVTLDVMSNLDEYGIVLIDSHGALVSKGADQYDQYIHIGQDFEEYTHGHSADFYSGRIMVTVDGKVAVNADFFRNRYGADSFDNTLFFLGTCYSMYDESISDVLIDCGAGVVMGYTDKVTVGYCNDTLKACLQTNLLQAKNTAIEAHTATLDACGNTDPVVSNCRFVYDGNRNYSYVAQYGNVMGSIISSDSSTPISWARIQMIGNNGQTYDFIQTGDVFEKTVDAGSYTVIISAYGYLSRTLSNVVIVNGQTTYIEESILIDGSAQTQGQTVINGKVVNALNGEVVAGATVKFIPGHGGTAGSAYVTDNSGSVITLTTDENGAFSINTLVKGYYTAEVSIEGFVTEYSNVIASQSEAEQEIAITPVLSVTDDYRIILSWNASPADIDSHVEGIWPSNEGHFHVCFYDMEASRNGERIASLDLDDRNGYGPETVTLTVDPEAQYVYYVHNFSGEAPLYTSGAQVKVYQGNTLLQTYNVPVERVSGSVWNVFKIENGRLVTINQITN